MKRNTMQNLGLGAVAFLSTCMMATHGRGDAGHHTLPTPLPPPPPTFHFLAGNSACNDYCTPSEASVYLRFDASVDPVTIVSALRIVPAVPLRARSIYASNTVYVVGDFAPDTRYVVTAPASLVDPRAGRLGNDGVVHFHVGHEPAVARMPLGQALLGPGRPLPIQLERVHGARLRVVRLDPADLDAAANLAGAHEASDDPIRHLSPALQHRVRERRLDAPGGTGDDAVVDVDVFALAGGSPVLAVLDAPETDTRATVVQRGELSVLLKVGRTSGLAWVTRTRSGAPAANADVTIWDADTQRFHGHTDGEGIVRLPGRATLEVPAAQERAAARGNRDDEDDEGGEGEGGEGEGEWQAARPLRAVATVGRDVAFTSTVFSSGLENWQFGVPVSYSTGADALRGMVTAERGIYRPGETVHVLGVMRRRLGDGRLRSPSGVVDVAVSDPDGTLVTTQHARLTPFGTFRVAIPVGHGARLGRWYVRATQGDGMLSGDFDVGEYRVPSFEVVMPQAGAAHADGDVYEIPFSARYLYGAPVRDAAVSYRVSWRPRVIEVPGFEPYSFGASEGTGELAELTSGDLVLDHDGNGSITVARASVPLEGAAGNGAQAVDLVVEASVRDVGDEEITGHTVQTVDRTDVRVGVRNDSWVIDARRGWNVSVVAVGADGHPVAGRALHVEVSRLGWTYAAEEDGGEARYGGHYETTVTTTQDLVSRASATPLHLDTTVGGEYRVRIVDRTSGGTAEAQVWAYGDDAYGPVHDSPRVDLRADARSYRPGDVAHVLVASPYASATALVTTEREGVLTARTMRLQGESAPIAISLDGRDLPNVMVGVALVPNGLGTASPAAGAPLRMGYTSLEVSPEQRHLHVTVRPEQREMKPGETARVHVAVADAAGRPVSAEVTLWAADDGVLQLTGYHTPDPFAPAYAPAGLAVDTSANLVRWTTHAPTDEWEGGGIGDAGGPGRGALRSRFLSTAFFSRGVVTGADGNAVLNVPLPDNLTRWRVMAAVADRAELFGAGESTITASKPLQVTPSLPRFLVQGDEAELGVVVHDDTGREGPVDLRLEVLGAQLVGPARRRVDMSHGGQVPVHFQVAAHEVGDVIVRAWVAKGRERDGFEIKLPAEAPSQWSSLLVGDGAVDGVTTANVVVPADATPGLAELTVTVAPSLVASLESGLDSLVQYPNGCVEQTTSLLIPMVLLEDLVKASPRFSTSAHRQKMEAAIDHVYEHQNADGGFGLWPTSDSEGFLTAYALWGLLTTRDHGYDVSATRLHDATTYLERHATEGDDMHGQFSTAETDPFAAYVLAYAHADDHGLTSRLTGSRTSLSRFALGLLATAEARRHGDVVPLENDLHDARTRQAGGGMVVHDAPPSSGSHDFLGYGRDLRATSSAVQSLVAAGRTGEASELVAGILAQRERDGSWGTTYNNLWALYAISTYAEAQQVTQHDIPIVVRVGGHDVARATLSPGATVKQLVIPASALPAPGQSVTLEIAAPHGSGARYSARLRYVVDLRHQPAEDHGLHVERRLLDAETGAVVTTPHVGQLLRVELHVRSPNGAPQVALTDRLPAGFEPVDTNLATERNAAAARGQDWTWRWREIHDDRVSFFADQLYAGDHVAEYLVRVSHQGTFTRPAPTAECMYDPTIWSRGSAENIGVTPAAATH